MTAVDLTDAFGSGVPETGGAGPSCGAEQLAVCPVCEKGVLVPFVHVEDVPVFCNVLWPTREAALAAPRGKIRLGYCERCGMIRNLDFDGELVPASSRSGRSLPFSPSFRAYAQGLARRLIDRYDLRGKDLVDIGCGKGEFIAMLCDETGNRGVGFDPAYDGESNGARAEGLRFVRDYYSETYGETPADFISCRHVLEHVESPRELLGTVSRTTPPHSGVTLYFEMPDGGYMLRENAVWDVIYEHPSYFTAPALRCLFEDFGFTVLDIGTSFGDQYLWIEAVRNGDTHYENGSSASQPAQLARLVGAFERRYAGKIAHWGRRLEALFEDEKRVALWGAGSKGVTFLNVVPGGDQVGDVIDLNVRKHGRFVPGTGQEVGGPQSLRAARPDVILVPNRLYTEEIRRWVADMDLRAEVVPV
jgi:hypothetical protein